MPLDSILLELLFFLQLPTLADAELCWTFDYLLPLPTAVHRSFNAMTARLNCEFVLVNLLSRGFQLEDPGLESHRQWPEIASTPLKPLDLRLGLVQGVPPDWIPRKSDSEAFTPF